jgi:hypothetical protein
MKNNTLIIACVLVAVVFGGGGFYGGMQYANAQRPSGAARFAGATGANAGQFVRGQNGQNGQGGQRGGFGGGASGQVVSKDDKSLTLSIMGGGSKVVYYSASTTVNKTAAGSLDDVAQGSNVMVIGSSNADGSVTASMIQLRPADQAPNGR